MLGFVLSCPVLESGRANTQHQSRDLSVRPNAVLGINLNRAKVPMDIRFRVCQLQSAADIVFGGDRAETLRIFFCHKV